jgi:enoyl-CoA hydratase/carnithine racemase
MARSNRSVAEPPFVLSKDSGRVRWLTLNRPAERNPLSLGMIRELAEALDRSFADSSIRVIVIEGAGPVFSAGHHLKEMGNYGGSESDRRLRQEEILRSCANLMLGIQRGPKPVIACVPGIATAAGCQLVSACDLAIASEQAQFGTPGVNIGAFCTTPLVGIGRKMHRKHAMEMALTGDLVSAQDAYRFGLINRVVPLAELHEVTERLAQRIALKSAQAIASGKPAFYRQIEMPIEEAFAFATRAMIDAAQAEDAKEGSKAFFEKRPPVWSGL